MPRFARCALALALAAAAFSLAVDAQAPAPADRIPFGSVELALGMPEKPIIEALERHYHVERARSAGDDWAVSEGTKNIGVVSFSAGKLARVSKTWLSTRDRGAALLAGQLYRLAGQFTGEGRAECTLSAKPYAVAGAGGLVVTLACGAKSVQLFQTRVPPSGSTTSLQEVLQ
ncbi:MAG TPA: hypothetical protein VGS20_09610 [Candidatus Acidoferrales bacterium]|nr:hypothetical protein [Candidatus Acidoferrales bacterium]